MSLGMRSQEWRRIFEDIRALGVKHRDKIRKKNRKKVKHLVRKHGRRPKSGWEDLPKPWRTTMGNPRIFNDKEDLLKEDVKEPMVVKGMEEDLSLTDSEMELLKLGPKFCVYKNLSEEEFETDIEECIMKVKWDLMKDDGKKAPGTEDIALEVLLGSEVCRSIEEEAEEEEDILDAERRTIFDWRTRTMNFGRRRATDCKGNSRVFFPRKARTVEEEMSLQTLRDMLMVTFRKYVDEKCGKEGKQCRNLSKVQEAGLKSLKKRVKEGEVMIVPTDKSGSLAVMSRTAYVESGMSHTRKDKEVRWEEIRDSQRELNGHVSMLAKIFRIGANWGHEQRIRETLMKENQAVCPLSLLFKDHKGCRADQGTTPPTRPVAGGHLGIKKERRMAGGYTFG